MRPIPAIALRDGAAVPRLGLGTCRMGEDAARRRAEVAALQLGLDLGMRLIDTAEMYGGGGAERVVGEAIRGRREDAFIVSKFYPHHAAQGPMARACEASLRRLRVEALDLYLLHWRGSVPLADTVEGLMRLVHEGKILRWGVSNFDTADMRELVGCPEGGRVAANQVLYNPARRGVEFDLLPLCRDWMVAVMAYSPLDEGRLATHPGLAAVAGRLALSPAQVALAWLLRDANCLVIPKAADAAHVRGNRAAVEATLDSEAIAAIDRAFPPPRRKGPLEMV